MKSLDTTIEKDLVVDDHRIQRKTQLRQMQKLVVMLTGILFIFAGSFPLAMWRVSQSEQFNGAPFKQLPKEAGQKADL